MKRSLIEVALAKTIFVAFALGACEVALPVYAAGPMSAVAMSGGYQDSGRVEAIDYLHNVITINDRGYVIPAGTPVSTAHSSVTRDALRIGSYVEFNSAVTNAGLTLTEIRILGTR